MKTTIVLHTTSTTQNNSSFQLLAPLLSTLLSLSRYMVVAYPLTSKFKQNAFVRKILFSVVSLSSVVAVFVTTLRSFFQPALPFRLCNALTDPFNLFFIDRPLTMFVCVYKHVAICIMILLYIKLFISLKESKASLGNAASKENSNKSLIIQIIVTVAASILCWTPESIVHLVTLFLDNYPIELVIWTTVIVMPIHSFVIPIVFSVTNIKKIYS